MWVVINRFDRFDLNEVIIVKMLSLLIETMLLSKKWLFLSPYSQLPKYEIPLIELQAGAVKYSV